MPDTKKPPFSLEGWDYYVEWTVDGAKVRNDLNNFEYMLCKEHIPEDFREDLINAKEVAAYDEIGDLVIDRANRGGFTHISEDLSGSDSIVLVVYLRKVRRGRPYTFWLAWRE